MARNTWEERSRKFCLYTNTYTRVEPWGWKVCTNNLFLLLIEWNKIIIIVSQLFFQVHSILLWGMLSKKVSLTLCLPFPTVTKWAGKEDWHVSSLGTGFEKINVQIKIILIIRYPLTITRTFKLTKVHKISRGTFERIF